MAKKRSIVEPRVRELIVEKYLSGEMSAPELSKKYGVGISTIYTWANRYKKVNVNTTVISENDIQEKDNQIKDLQEEIEILKKALNIFAK